MNRTLVLLFTLLTSTFVNGQILNSYGFKGGVSIANQTHYYKSPENKLVHDFRIGFYGTATVEFLHSKYFNFTTDIGFCTKGYKQDILNTTVYRPEGDGTYKTHHTKFNYFTFSPMLKVKYETTNFVPYVLLGFRMDQQLSYKSDFNLESIDKNMRKTIWGANLGVGAEYKTKQLGIFLEGQYQHDFTKVMDIPPSANSAGLTINNKAFVFSLGMRYYLNKSK